MERKTTCPDFAKYMQQWKFPTHTYQAWQKDLKKHPTLHSLAPKKDHDIDPEKLEHLLSRITTPSDKQLVRQVADEKKTTTYISFSKLVDQLHSQLKKFLDAIKGQPFLMIFSEIHPDKSNYWISFVAYDLLASMKRTPEAVCSIHEALLEHPQIVHCLLVDDMMYSGEQMANALSYISEEEQKYQELCAHSLSIKTSAQKQYAVVVVGCTDESLEEIKGKISEEFDSRVHIFCAHAYKPLKKLIGEEKARQFGHMLGNRFAPSKYPVVFQHKLADSASTFPDFYTQILKNCENIPQCFVPHYKNLFS